MGAGSIRLPEGFVLDQQAPSVSQELPDGFVLDQPSQRPQGFTGNITDFLRSIPDAAAKAFYNSGQGLRTEGEFFNQPFTGGALPPEAPIPTGFPLPQGKAGEFGAAVGSALGNPVSWMGPGGPVLKGVGAVLSGLGGRLGKDTGIPGGELAGSLIGGAVAAGAAGPRAAEAAIPNAAELKAAAKVGGEHGGYKGALDSELELDPSKVGLLATAIEQRLNKAGFTGGPNGTAKGTLSDIASLQSPPTGSTITAANLDTIRATLGQRAQEITTDARGLTKPTPDAVAAQQALKDFNKYVENIPQSHVLAGDAEAYKNSVAEANANYAASKRTEAAEQRIQNATYRYERKPNVTLGSQLKGQFGPMLEKDSRTAGFTPEERAKVEDINSAGGKVIDLLGSRSLPAMAVHALLGIPSLGMSLPASVIANYGARKLGSALTAKQAKQLTEMLAKRSPLYQQRVNAISPQESLAGNTGQIVRSGILGGL